ncbi:MAG: hypothetical protein J7M29_07595, partial [Verrucomicrobia bacterium]|nr:hypothetical protein [Verrucomicrobiota bacterium]
LLVRYNIRDFFGRRAWWLLPTTVAIVGISLLSGHRSVIIFPAFTVILVAWSQRFLRPKNLVIAAVAGVMLASAAYITAPRLPLAAQRALSFLPGIKIDSQAAQDARMTWFTRRVLFSLGLEMAPRYLLVGRGFSKFLDRPRREPDVIPYYLEEGTFFNGLVGLLVNTGLAGTISMFLFMYGGLRLAWRITKHIRRYGAEDSFARAASLMSANYMVNVLTFLFLHGNAEWAMKYFSVLGGMLIVASRILERREEEAAAGAAAEATGAEESALEKDVPAREPLAQPT